MRYVVLMCALLAGCVAPPITITQDGRQTDNGEHPPAKAPGPWVIVIYARDAESEPPVTSNAEVTPPTHPECPPFELPDVGEAPSVPDYDRSRGGDYEYIAGVLIDHVEALMQYNAGVKRQYAKAYDRYLATCELAVD